MVDVIAVVTDCTWSRDVVLTESTNKSFANLTP